MIARRFTYLAWALLSSALILTTNTTLTFPSATAAAQYNQQQQYSERGMTARTSQQQPDNYRGKQYQTSYGYGTNKYDERDEEVEYMKKNQMYQQRARNNDEYNDNNKSSCTKVITVPKEVVEKYSWYSIKHNDDTNKMMTIDVCCDGYGPRKWRGETKCEPLCDNCRNGRCVAPNECKCHEEYVSNDNGDCVFTCPLGCLNGQCYLDGTCQCDLGYKLDETRKFCRPICSAGCNKNVYHNCTEPEVCACAKGYQLTYEGCMPTCEPACGAGGRCENPNFCVCINLSYSNNNKGGPCESQCYQKCDNGICYGRNRCICNPGYTYHERSTQCVPV